MASPNILIVEDEEIVALDIEMMLRDLGYGVVGAVASGEEAIAIATENPLDLVLMDIMLRGEMDGIQAAAEIHTRFRIPVVYLTAHADVATLQRAKVTEPFGYLLKPFEEKALQTTIEIALYRHQAEERMQKALDKERELKELKSNFVATASHEFRTPLSTILLATESLEYYNQNDVDEKKRKRFQLIKDSVMQMKKMLDEVLVLEKAEASKLSFQPQPLDLINFCANLVQEIQISRIERHVINFVTMGEPASASMDADLLRHILSNLLSNAIKYSPLDRPIEFHLTFFDEQAQFCIRDFGIGIPATDLPYLFESFHRASNVDKIPGTGLGLAIVKRCVELHHGQISVASEVGSGSTFTVSLPLVSAPVAEHQRPLSLD